MMIEVEALVRGTDGREGQQVCVIPSPPDESEYRNLDMVRRILQAVAKTGFNLPPLYHSLASADDWQSKDYSEQRAKGDSLGRAVKVAVLRKPATKAQRLAAAEKIRSRGLRLLASLESVHAHTVLWMSGMLDEFDAPTLRTQLASLISSAEVELKLLGDKPGVIELRSPTAQRTAALPPLERRLLALWYLFNRELAPECKGWPALQNSNLGVDAFTTFALACLAEHQEPMDVISFQRMFRKLQDKMDQPDENRPTGPRVLS